MALAGLLILVVLGALALKLSSLGPSQAPSSESQAGADIGGPFRLVDQEGRPADQSILTGKWSAVFFGYTFCPDTCPATLQALGAASRKLPAGGKPFQTVFISVDPARDTPQSMKTYLESQGFPAHAVGLTGSPDAVAAAAKAYRIYYAKVGTGSDYTMDHSAAIMLMDPQGRFNRALSEQMGPDFMARQISAAERGG